jgi:hypothetical protein
MRKFCFLAVAAAALALLGTDQAKAGGRRVRYYSYGTSAATTKQATSQTAQSTTGTRRYSYSPSVQNRSDSFYMGQAPYNNNYYRADRKIRGW